MALVPSAFSPVWGRVTVKLFKDDCCDGEASGVCVVEMVVGGVLLSCGKNGSAEKKIYKKRDLTGRQFCSVILFRRGRKWLNRREEAV